MHSDTVMVLVHSPLVGPSTWLLVGNALRRHHIDVVIPTLIDSDLDIRPYWEQHANAVAQALLQIPADRSLILVGHSGAGPFLPAIRQMLPHTISAYIFVDAGLPRDGANRLDLLMTESPALATQFRQHLEAGGRFPDWTDAQLRAVIPDPKQRRHVLAELLPRGLPFFTEAIPVFRGWPDAPCAYIQLSAAYDSHAAYARQAMWPVYTTQAEHFHVLVAPEAVTDMLLEAVSNIAPEAHVRSSSEKSI